MAVTYEEVNESPITTWDTTGSGKWTTTRQLKCDWDDRITLMNEFLEPFPGVSHPDNAYARANTASIKPAGTTVEHGDPTAHKWTYAIVTIGYSTPGPGQPIVDLQGNVLSETLEASSEFLTLDHSSFHWDSGTGPSLKPEEAPGRLNLGFDYVFTRYNVTTVPLIALDLLGQVNDSLITSNYLGLTFAPEALLYTALTLNHRSGTAAGVVDYTMRFSFRQNWNEFWRIDKVGGPGYSRIYLADGTPYNNYPLGDFSQL